jgi:hypothetical protein
VGKSNIAFTHRRYFRTFILASQGKNDPQLTAFFTSAMIFASSAAVNFINAKLEAHIFPSSNFASG